MMRKLPLCCLALAMLVGFAGAQAVPTASRTTQLQIGVAGSSFTLDYGQGREEGFEIFGDADFAHHLGIEALYRNASIVTPYDTGENHLLVGPRFRFTRGRFMPYAKVLFGQGTINYQQGYNAKAYSQSYFIYSLGGGLDVRATTHINIRVIDFEYQEWPGFPPNGLTPNGFSVGAAYSF